MLPNSSAVAAAQARELAGMLAAAQAEVASTASREASHAAAAHAAARALEDAQAQRRTLVRQWLRLIEPSQSRCCTNSGDRDSL